MQKEVPQSILTHHFQCATSSLLWKTAEQIAEQMRGSDELKQTVENLPPELQELVSLADAQTERVATSKEIEKAVSSLSARLEIEDSLSQNEENELPAPRISRW